MLKKKIREQISDIRNPILFKALHWKGHMHERHLLTNEEMREVIKRRAPLENEDDIVMVTRFNSFEEALELTAQTLEENVEKIAEWLMDDCSEIMEFTSRFPYPTGDGLIKNADWTNFVPVHGVNVVLCKGSCIPGQSFVVTTSYPIRTFEDIDNIYDAIDDYTEKRNSRN